MVAFNESNLVPCNPFRARPRVRGSNFATVQRPLHPGASLKGSLSQPQGLLGNSLTSPKRLHRADHSNQQYSILAISNSSGAVIERVAYQAYGQPTFVNAAGTTLSSSAKATRYSFTGREWDQSLELHHFRARWMSGTSGRFLCWDPEGLADSLNIFQFLGGCVLVGIDPSGTGTEIPCTVLATTTATGWCSKHGGIKSGPKCFRGITILRLHFDTIEVTCSKHECLYGVFIELHTKEHGYCDYRTSCKEIKCPCLTIKERAKVCREIIQGVRTGRKCKQFRDRMRNECYPTTEDDGHKQQREESYIYLDFCKQRAADCKCEGVASVRIEDFPDIKE